MYRGSTPTHTFTIPFSADNIASVVVCYKQTTGEFLKKTSPDVTIVGNVVTVNLTKEDTEVFTVDRRIPVTKVRAQIIIHTIDLKTIPLDYVEIVLKESLEEP